MAKPNPFKGQRGVALLQGTAKTAADATTPDWVNVQNKPAEFPPSTHSHADKADDSAVVHNTGDEEIAGEKTFNADILFGTDALGIILIDRTTATEYRLYVDVGVLLIEAI